MKPRTEGCAMAYQRDSSPIKKPATALRLQIPNPSKVNQ